MEYKYLEETEPLDEKDFNLILKRNRRRNPRWHPQMQIASSDRYWEIQDLNDQTKENNPNKDEDKEKDK
jgi:hypothetical protein